MERRICPTCEGDCYSADTISEYWICCHCGAKIPKEREVEPVEEPIGYYTKKPGSLLMKPATKMTRYDQIRNMSIEEMAIAIVCPNEMGMAEIECDKSDDLNCCQCCLDWLREEVEEE